MKHETGVDSAVVFQTCFVFQDHQWVAPGLSKVARAERVIFPFWSKPEPPVTGHPSNAPRERVN
jgi:hypothetical protein